jgi:hypothetical protein
VRARFVALAPAAALLGAAGCGSDPDPAEPLIIRADEYWVTDDGVVAGEVDLAGIAVYELRGDALVALPVEVYPTEARVLEPPARYYVAHDGRWFVAEGTALDLHRYRLGRPDAVVAAEPATLDLTLTGLAPWQTGDLVQLYSRGAGLWRLATVGGVAADATELTTAIDFAAEALPRIEGDATWAAQLTTRSFAGRDYRAIARAAELPAIDLAAEPASAAAAALAEPADEILDVDWRISAFDDLRLLQHPVVAQSFYDLGVAALPAGGSISGRQYGTSADLAILRTTDAAGLDLAGAFGYGSPFPSSFLRLLTAVAWYPNSHQAPGADVPAVLFDAIWSRIAVHNLDGPLLPLVGPPQNLAVDGRTLSWDAPETGTVAWYEVELYVLTSVDGATVIRPGARVEVRAGRSLVLADDLLDPDADATVARIAAITVDPEGWASEQTGVILAP